MSPTRFLIVFAAACLSGQAVAQEEPPPPPPMVLEGEAPTEAPTSPRPMKAGRGGPGGPPGYSVFWFPSQAVEGQPADFAVVRQSLNVGAPIWVSGPDKVILTASIRNSLFDTAAILPDSGQPFPQQLWNANVGVMYAREFANGWTGSTAVSVGSASDQPFESLDVMTFNFLGTLKIPTRNGRDAWLLSLMYSPVGNVTFPIPGVAYAWSPNDRLDATIGVPFIINWRPTDDWSLAVSYFPITNVSAKVTRILAQRLSAYASFEWLYEAYFLADRQITDDRFMGFEKRLAVGLRWDVCSKGAIDVQAGYVFDRTFGIGQNQLGDLSDRVDVDPGAFVGATFALKF